MLNNNSFTFTELNVIGTRYKTFLTAIKWNNNKIVSRPRLEKTGENTVF